MAVDFRDDGVRANAVGIAANLALAALKLTVGVVAGSQALLADGYNSAGDVIATAIGWTGYQLAQSPPDDNHHYGHGNAESVAGLIIGAILFATGAFICIDSLAALASGVEAPPEPIAAAAALVTMVTKEVLYRWVHRVGTRLNSPALLASARDHRADVLSAATVLGGIAAAQFGAPWLDAAGALLVGVYIAWMAVEPLRTNAGVLMDEAPPELDEEIRRVARSVEEVRECEGVRVHPLGSYFMVDLEIYLDGEMDLFAAHDIAHAVADRVREQVDHVRDVRVHVNPTGLRDSGPPER